jgi:signal transduction histidine kinase
MDAERTSWWRLTLSAPGTTTSDRARATLGGGVLVFRWVGLAWMTVLAATTPTPLRRPVLAWATIGVAALWTLWLSGARRQWSRSALWLDLAVCMWLILASGVVVASGEVVSGRPFFATAYPLAAALMWGAAGGPSAGLVSGSLLGAALVVSRPLNGVALGDLTAAQAQNVIGAVLNYLVAGAAIGLVSRLLERSGQAVAQANAELVVERERAARLSERESLARQIHDSVLQALAYVHKRGLELGRKDSIRPDDVVELARMAEQQESELRQLILRAPESAPTGRASLRDALEAAARDSSARNVTVSAVGPIWLQRATVDEIAAAVKQALENVGRHAQASKASVFAEHEDGVVTVTVRDDGVGFVFDEGSLKSAGKVGILKSMRGRVEDLGGKLTISSERGRGTEVELAVPVEQP